MSSKNITQVSETSFPLTVKKTSNFILSSFCTIDKYKLYEMLTVDKLNRLIHSDNLRCHVWLRVDDESTYLYLDTYFHLGS